MLSAACSARRVRAAAGSAGSAENTAGTDVDYPPVVLFSQSAWWQGAFLTAAIAALDGTAQIFDLLACISLSLLCKATVLARFSERLVRDRY